MGKREIEETTVDPEWWAEAKRTIARLTLLNFEQDQERERLQSDLARARSTIGQLRAQLARAAK